MTECFIALIKLYLIIIRLDCIWKPMFIKKTRYNMNISYIYMYVCVYMQAVIIF